MTVKARQPGTVTQLADVGRGIAGFVFPQHKFAELIDDEFA